MKKFIAFIFFLVLVVIATPFLLPQSIKKQILSYYTQDIPGKLDFEGSELNLLSSSKLSGITWKQDNNRLTIPELIISTPLISYIFNKNITYGFKDGTLYYKGRPLVEKIKTAMAVNLTQTSIALTMPAKMTCEISERGTRAFINHILIPPFSAPKVTLSLDKMSIKEFKLKTLKIEGNLDLGELRCARNHLLSVTLGLLKQKSQDSVTIKCGNIHFTSEKGIVAYPVTPFLLDNTFEILSKGTIDLIQDKVNISLGFTTQSLSRAFNLTALPDGYIVPFTITGSTHKPRIHTSQAIKNIATIILLEKIAPDQRIYPPARSL